MSLTNASFAVIDDSLCGDISTVTITQFPNLKHAERDFKAIKILGHNNTKQYGKCWVRRL